VCFLPLDYNVMLLPGIAAICNALEMPQLLHRGVEALAETPHGMQVRALQGSAFSE